jgi:hypothetical protein
MGLGLPPIKAKSTKMRESMRTLNLHNERRHGERIFIIQAHVHSLIFQFNHWPHEALESTSLKIPALRIPRHVSTILGLEFESLPSLHQDDVISTSIREASQAVDNTLQDKLSTLQGQVGTKKHDKLVVQQQCKPIKYSQKLFTHLALLREIAYTIGINSSQSKDTHQRTTRFIYNLPTPSWLDFPMETNHESNVPSHGYRFPSGHSTHHGHLGASKTP